MSIVSRSRSAAPPHFGQATWRNDGMRPSGEPPRWLISTPSIGSTTGSSRVGDRHDAAGGAVDHRDRRPPVALPGDPPVAQAVVRLAGAAALLLEQRDHPLLRRGGGKAAAGAGVHRGAVALERRRHRRRVQLAPRRAHDDRDRQPVLLRELEVALVVRGHGHHRPGAVLHQHEVRGPDRDLRAGQRVHRVRPGEDALLLDLARRARRALQAPGPLDERAHRAPPAPCRARARRPAGAPGPAT